MAKCAFLPFTCFYKEQEPRKQQFVYVKKDAQCLSQKGAGVALCRLCLPGRIGVKPRAQKERDTDRQTVSPK